MTWYVAMIMYFTAIIKSQIAMKNTDDSDAWAELLLLPLLLLASMNIMYELMMMRLPIIESDETIK
jgi:hypothetical protein